MPLLLCPNCQAGMQEINRNNVQVDVCPQCRGVWLDRGELEKLLGTVRKAEADWEHDRQYVPDKPGYGHLQQHGEYKHKKPHKKSMMHQIFEIFD